MPLPRRFYLRPASVVARDLLGCLLVSHLGRTLTAGRIVETEAYLGPGDAASHAAFRPSSHALFYGEGGHAYVFLNYGIHHCLNAITGPAGTPGCVLIRALEPVAGLAAMARRRGLPAVRWRLCSGPGNVTRALGVTLRDTGRDLTQGPLSIEPPDGPRDFRVETGRRVGITRGVDLRLRFWIRGHACVSGESHRARMGRSGGGRRAKPPSEDYSRASASGSKRRSGGFVLTATERTMTRTTSLPPTKAS